MNKIILSVTNDLSTDQRVNKVANSLFNAGYKVLLVGRMKSDSIPLMKRRYKCVRFNLFFERGFLFYLEYNIRLFFFLLFSRFDFLVANDLDTLLANYCVSKVRAKKLIYDSHELFTEIPELNNKKYTKYIWICLESMILPRIKYSYTVSASIALYYYNKYGIPMTLVRNFPFHSKLPVKKFKKNSIKKIIYQGAVNKDRGIALMIKSMQYVDAVLYIYGSGDILDEMCVLVKKLKLCNKVFFKGRVSFDKLFQFTSQADLGLSFEEDTCLSYRFSLPNKIFDYINSEIPILISDLPEFKKVIYSYNVGEVLLSRDEKEVASQITKILNVPREDWSKNMKLAKKEFCWENEEPKLLSCF